jgi:hypothetical protein
MSGSHVPYTVILQDTTTGSMSSRVMSAPCDSQEAIRYIHTMVTKEHHVMALVKGNHPVIPGLPTHV